MCVPVDRSFRIIYLSNCSISPRCGEFTPYQQQCPSDHSTRYLGGRRQSHWLFFSVPSKLSSTISLVDVRQQLAAFALSIGSCWLVAEPVTSTGDIIFPGWPNAPWRSQEIDGSPVRIVIYPSLRRPPWRSAPTVIHRMQNTTNGLQSVTNIRQSTVDNSDIEYLRNLHNTLNCRLSIPRTSGSFRISGSTIFFIISPP